MSEHAGLAAALAAFQSEMPTVTKDNTANVPTKAGGSYTYTYADLASLTKAAAPLLAKNGLAFTAQPRRVEDGGYELAGVLMHTGGQTLEGVLPIMGRTAQEIGSSLTYNRRYLLGCLTGLVTDDDDDGQAAQGAGSQRPARTPAGASEQQLKAISAITSKLGLTDEQRLEGAAYIARREITSTAMLTKAEASKYIDFLKQKEKEAAQQQATAEPTHPDGGDPWARAAETAAHAEQGAGQ